MGQLDEVISPSQPFKLQSFWVVLKIRKADRTQQELSWPIY